jgi:hypothetical protein
MNATKLVTYKATLTDNNSGKLLASFEEILPEMNHEQHQIWRLFKAIDKLNEQCKLNGNRVTWFIDGKEVRF